MKILALQLATFSAGFLIGLLFGIAWGNKYPIAKPTCNPPIQADLIAVSFVGNGACMPVPTTPRPHNPPKFA